MSEFTAHTWKEIRNMWSGPVKMCFQTDINAFDSHTKQTHALDWKETQINPTIKIMLPRLWGQAWIKIQPLNNSFIISQELELLQTAIPALFFLLLDLKKYVHSGPPMRLQFATNLLLLCVFECIMD